MNRPCKHEAIEITRALWRPQLRKNKTDTHKRLVTDKLSRTSTHSGERTHAGGHHVHSDALPRHAGRPRVITHAAERHRGDAFWFCFVPPRQLSLHYRVSMALHHGTSPSVHHSFNSNTIIGIMLQSFLRDFKSEPFGIQEVYRGNGAISPPNFF